MLNHPIDRLYTEEPSNFGFLTLRKHLGLSDQK